MDTRFFIFISHVHEERDLAIVLREWFHAAFPKLVTAFVSSDYEDNPLGKRWMDVIDGALEQARLLITLMSPRSKDRMWIHLEAGWALGRRIDILPICHSRLGVDDLPRPYSDFGAVEVDHAEFSRRLLVALKQRLGLTHNLPERLLAALADDVRAACNRIAESKETEARPAAAADPTVDDAQVAILQGLASMHGQDRDAVPIGRIASILGVSPAKATVLVRRLEEAGLVKDYLVMGEGQSFYVSDAGLEFLDKRGLL